MGQQQTLPNGVQIHNTLESSSPNPDETEQGGYELLAQSGEDGTYNLSVLVNGVHCAACIQKIESTIAKNKDVQNVRLNFTTRRLAIKWSGEKDQANIFVKSIENLGYKVQPFNADLVNEESKEQEKFLLMSLGVAGFALGNIMLLSVGVWSSSGEEMGYATREFFHWISALIAIPTILYSGRPFFNSALGALKNGHTNMDVPISIALILACSMSLHETIYGAEHVYFDSAVMLTFFLLIGRYLDLRARGKARESANDLLSTLSGFANVVDEDGRLQRILIRDLKEGMNIRVAMGETFPIDGEIISGQSEVDTSLVTGETIPRVIETGAQIYAGTLNLSAPVVVRVAKAAEDSLLADIVRLMEKAGQSQAKYVRIADKAAQLYTPVVHIAAAIAFIFWWGVMGIAWQEALMIAITVLIITCPCALGLAVPVVQVLASARLTKSGILVKSGDALERLASIDTIMFDKTGTLTHGKPSLINQEHELNSFKLAASLASYSHHPLSKALYKAYGDNEIVELSDVEEHSGEGLSARYNHELIRLGSRQWCGDKNYETSDSYMEIWFQHGDKKAVRFTFEDSPRQDAEMTIKHFHDDGIKTLMATGDLSQPAKAVASQCGIKEYYAEQKPDDKFNRLQELKEQKHNVLMVGDGLNDAPVLAGADISMAPGSALDMAQNAADIIFMGDQLAPVYRSWKTAKASQSLVKENFALAAIYNMIAVPLAFMGYVTPLVAALAMSGSSIIVIANSFRLRFAK